MLERTWTVGVAAAALMLAQTAGAQPLPTQPVPTEASVQAQLQQYGAAQAQALLLLELQRQQLAAMQAQTLPEGTAMPSPDSSQAQAPMSQVPLESEVEDEDMRAQDDTGAQEEVAVAPRAPSVTSVVSRLDAPEYMDARGDDEAAIVSWRPVAGSTAADYLVYCDDGSLSGASAAKADLASDECPSLVALSAGARPRSEWPLCDLVSANETGATPAGLHNGQPYAFAVAARSATGEIGPLSDVTCAIPSASGEYELDGTSAGTGGCSTSGTRDGAPEFTALGVLALLLGRRHSASSQEGRHTAPPRK